MKNRYDIVRRPIITEKASDAKDHLNKIVLAVDAASSKGDVKSAVEEIFKVKVRKVNILNTKSKPKRIGRHTGRRPGYKKAVVSLEEGHNIEVFDQV